MNHQDKVLVDAGERGDYDMKWNTITLNDRQLLKLANGERLEDFYPGLTAEVATVRGRTVKVYALNN